VEDGLPERQGQTTLQRRLTVHRRIQKRVQVRHRYYDLERLKTPLGRQVGQRQKAWLGQRKVHEWRCILGYFQIWQEGWQRGVHLVLPNVLERGLQEQQDGRLGYIVVATHQATVGRADARQHAARHRHFQLGRWHVLARRFHEGQAVRVRRHQVAG